jgi:hypothetical protein
MILDPFGPLIYKEKISDEFLTFLQDVAKESENGGAHVGWDLAGNIEGQIGAVADAKQFMSFVDPHVKDYIRANLKRASEYMINFQEMDVDNIDYNLGNGPWINYQKQHEFNPLHYHYGIISAVIFIDIPEVISKEMDDWEGKSNSPCPGLLEFAYANSMFMCSGSHRVIPKTGDMYLFPAELKHCVYPFKSDVTRISMSFNVKDLQFKS